MWSFFLKIKTVNSEYEPFVNQTGGKQNWTFKRTLKRFIFCTEQLCLIMNYNWIQLTAAAYSAYNFGVECRIEFLHPFAFF